MATSLKVYEIDEEYYLAWCVDGDEGGALGEAWDKQAPEDWENTPIASMTVNLRERLELSYAVQYVRESGVEYKVKQKETRPFYCGAQPFLFGTTEEARYALRAAKDGIKAAREEFEEVKKAKKENKKHEPSWIVHARAAGWSPSKKE